MPDKNIWCYTGYLLEDLLFGNVHIDITDDLLNMIDVLVDGKYIDELRDISLKYRGSSNQRIIDLKQTLAKKELILVKFD